MAKQIPIMTPMMALKGTNIEKKVDIDGENLPQISIVAKRIDPILSL